MEVLNSELLIYRDITMELIESLKNDNYDVLEELLSKRQEIIDRIGFSEYSKEAFDTICSELKIMEYEQKLNDSMTEKLNITKDELKKTSKGRNINLSYNKSLQVDSIFFNKKI